MLRFYFMVRLTTSESFSSYHLARKNANYAAGRYTYRWNHKTIRVLTIVF